MSKLYFRIYDGTNHLLVSTRSLCLAKAILYSADPAKGPYHFFAGGFAEDLAPFLSPECSCISAPPDQDNFSLGKRSDAQSVADWFGSNL